MIISQIPHSFTKIAGKLIGGSKPVLNAILRRPEHADEAIITNKISYTREGNNPWKGEK